MKKKILSTLLASCIITTLLAGYGTNVEAKQEENETYKMVEVLNIQELSKTGLYADGIFSPGRLGSMQKVDKVVPSEEMQRGERTLYSPGKFGEEKTVGSIINDMKGKGRWLSPGKFGEMVG